ncbi:hypothetical protein PC129_g15418 [Phytophthora cactorum]|uniref:Uncharacterized protein n=1 Tax=Phytophthora cactorum TaxID=29920 RepID=A0A8T1HNR7_9STRA|nr:hypothetical protein PC129_g15418 [Phytophthora cactorum]
MDDELLLLVFSVDDLVVPPELVVVLLPDVDVDPEDVPSVVLAELDESLVTTTPTITPTMARTTTTAMMMSARLGIPISSCL